MKWLHKFDYGFRLFNTIQIMGQDPERDHGELIYIFTKKAHYSVEYDRDGELILVYSPHDLTAKVKVAVFYLSKVYTRKGGETYQGKEWVDW